ncbi:MAG: hypothetical protein JSS66_10195 [Armatimonadetes bacterium]|nr:hypothetical protein [Armatimonadota bacterium]
MKQDNKIHRLVKEIADMAEHASLTGSLETGKSALIKRYNSVVETLEDEDELPHGLFKKLSDSAEFGEIGVEARLLYAYLRDGNGNGGSSKHGDMGVVLRLAPFVSSEDLTGMVKAYMAEGCKLDDKLLTALAPFLEKGMLSELVRSMLGKSAGASVVVVDTRKSPGSAEAPAAPQPPAPVEPVAAEATMGDQDLIDQITEELMRDDLSPEDRKKLGEQLKSLTKKASSLPE